MYSEECFFHDLSLNISREILAVLEEEVQCCIFYVWRSPTNINSGLERCNGATSLSYFETEKRSKNPLKILDSWYFDALFCLNRR